MKYNTHKIINRILTTFLTSTWLIDIHGFLKQNRAERNKTLAKTQLFARIFLSASTRKAVFPECVKLY